MALIKCDKCDWQQTVQSTKEIMKWHNKICPKCKDSIIINDTDLALLKATMELEKMGVIMQAGTNTGTQEEPHLKIRIDTSHLRK